MKKNNLKKYWKVFLIESLLFLLVISLGVVGTIKRLKILSSLEIDLDYISISGFLIQFSIITLFLFLFSRFVKKENHKGALFKLLFILAIFSGGVFIFNLWLSDIISLVLIGLLILLWSKKRNVFIHNLCVMLGIAGTISITGLSIKPITVVFLLVLFSIYDFIAVYKTKHMVKMAKSMIQSGAILGFIIPHQFSFFNKKIDSIDKDWAFVLGGGDIAFPLLLVCSLIPSSISDALIVALFSLFGLFLSFYIFINQKKKKPIPALPPIALLSVIGYLIVKFLI